MTKLIYNSTNTEGAHGTAFEFRDTELRKDAKKVATDLVDLYDVEITDPQTGDAITYNETIGKWVNSPNASGGGCNVFTGYENNKVFLDDATSGDVGSNDGSSVSPFKNLKECFDWLNSNCMIITSEGITLTLLGDIYAEEKTYLHHKYGANISIDGQRNKIKVTHNIDDISSNPGGGYVVEVENLNLTGNIFIDDNHSIKLINNIIFYHNIIFNPGIPASVVTQLDDYRLNMVNVTNNSSVVMTECLEDTGYSYRPLPTYFKTSLGNVKNNSSVESVNENFVLSNNSSLRSIPAISRPFHILTNGCVIITDDPSRFNLTTLTNSKVIQYF